MPSYRMVVKCLLVTITILSYETTKIGLKMAPTQWNRLLYLSGFGICYTTLKESKILLSGSFTSVFQAKIYAIVADVMEDRDDYKHLLRQSGCFKSAGKARYKF